MSRLITIIGLCGMDDVLECSAIVLKLKSEALCSYICITLKGILADPGGFQGHAPRDKVA